MQRLANYVYGTISTLVAIAGLTYEKHPGALTTAGVVVVGAVSIWFAHALSQLVITESWQQPDHPLGGHRGTSCGDRGPSLSAAIPATFIFLLAETHLWTVGTAFVLAEVVGVLALAVVGIGTAGRRRVRRPAAPSTSWAWCWSAWSSCSSNWSPTCSDGEPVGPPGSLAPKGRDPRGERWPWTVVPKS